MGVWLRVIDKSGQVWNFKEAENCIDADNGFYKFKDEGERFVAFFSKDEIKAILRMED